MLVYFPLWIMNVLNQDHLVVEKTAGYFAFCCFIYYYIYCNDHKACANSVDPDQTVPRGALAV